jgi:predicted NBD/HSP70 family sugar kinase
LAAAIVEHNVSAMALAESRYGVGKAASSLLYVYLRTGLGAGLIVDGTAFRPGGQGAVELGHIQVAADGHHALAETADAWRLSSVKAR